MEVVGPNIKMKQETVAPMILRSARVCHSVVSNSFATPWTEACQAPRLWNYPGVITGVGCHFLLQGIFLTQGSNSSCISCIGRWILYCCTTWEALIYIRKYVNRNPSKRAHLSTELTFDINSISFSSLPSSLPHP